MRLSKQSSIAQRSRSKTERFKSLLRQHFIIISKTWWQVVLVALYTSCIVSLNLYFGTIFYMGWSDSLFPILGVVTSLLLVFRTNTSYDRYYEGRKLWSQMTHVIRVLVRSIWTIVPEESGQDLVEKKSVTNILLSYAVASKHYLREEYSYHHEDLQELIHHFPQMVSEPRMDVMNKFRILNYAPPSNIPLQILYYVACFVQTMKNRHKWDSAVSGIFYNGLNSLSDCLSGFERIKRTPIPPAYSIHIYHVIWLYILSLPFQLTDSMGWWTVAGVAITAFTFLGILEIGYQIEDPFGYDDNDLVRRIKLLRSPLEDLCHVLGTEINEILSVTFPTHEELYLSKNYFPIANCDVSAADLSRKSTTEIRNLLQQTHNRYTFEPLEVNLTSVKILP